MLIPVRVQHSTSRLATSSLSRDGGCFDSFRAAMGEAKSRWNFSVANNCLDRIYVEMGLARPADVPQTMWERWAAEEGDDGERRPEGGI